MREETMRTKSCAWHNYIVFLMLIHANAFLQSKYSHNFIINRKPLFTERLDCDYIIHLVNTTSLGDQVVSISERDLPIFGEFYAAGKFHICAVKSLKSSNAVSTGKSESSIAVAPLLEVLLIDDTSDYNSDSIIAEKTITIDVGQLTTIWKFPIQYTSLKNYATILSTHLADARLCLQQEFPVNTREKVMKKIYETKKQKRSTIKYLSKKDIQQLCSSISTKYGQHTNRLMQKAFKVGLHDRDGNLVDSLVTSKMIFTTNNKASIITKLFTGAQILGLDAEYGGRFKRVPCMFVSAKYVINEHNAVIPSHINILNGGWIAVDESVKVLTEAKKFAQRSSTVRNETKTNIFTAADERIIQRLECFALGEKPSQEGAIQDLELDLRETLKSFSLPFTPEGAQQALVKIGTWSSVPESDSDEYSNYAPFPSKVLDCALRLENVEKKRRRDLYTFIRQKTFNSSKLEGRVDLTHLPVISIDAKRASFRDDAIGVRPRSSTGRNITQGSKWELLIHITDVSDIYFSKSSIPIDLSLLRETAEIRGTSRYDLPLGPLHLIPPVALKALSLDTKQKSDGNKQDSVNRCVTVWIYINSLSGNVIDCGIERTLIQRTTALSFEEATALLESTEDSLSTQLQQVKLLLTILENILIKWKDTLLLKNVAAQNRERRLNTRLVVSKETFGDDLSRDDGADGSFVRTRAHKVVDYALDLYGNALASMMKKSNAPFPRISGSGSAERGGRVGTAPLRRYVDGIVQRQAVSVLCNYGDPPLSKEECVRIGRVATDAINRISNSRSMKNRSKALPHSGNFSSEKKKALRALETHFASVGSSESRITSALSTGLQNEVIILGVGLRVICKGVKGTLKSGERVRVKITKLDSKSDTIEIELMQ